MTFVGLKLLQTQLTNIKTTAFFCETNLKADFEWFYNDVLITGEENQFETMVPAVISNSASRSTLWMEHVHISPKPHKIECQATQEGETHSAVAYLNSHLGELHKLQLKTTNILYVQDFPPDFPRKLFLIRHLRVVKLGETALYSCEIEKSGSPIKIDWFKDMKPIEEWDIKHKITSKSIS